MKQPVKLGIAMMLFIMMIKLASAQNSVPQLINYQGYLTDSDGKAINGQYKVTFRLSKKPTGISDFVWEEVHDSLTIENGMFNVLLGSVEMLVAEDLAGERYLEVEMDGEPEMEPRMRLASVPYSFHADKLDNENAADFVHVTGDTMTGPLVLSGTEPDITTLDNEHLNLSPNGTGMVGIGTDHPKAKLDVSGGIFVHGSAPFEFRRYSYTTIGSMNNAIAVDYNTGWKSADWAAAIVGYDAGFGDLMENDNQKLWRIQMAASGGNWHIMLNAPTHGGKNPDWTIDVLYIKKELVNSDY